MSPRPDSKFCSFASAAVFNLFGAIRAVLPQPDMVVTKTSWSLYLPDEVTYGEPDTNMRVFASRERVSGREISQQMEVGGIANGMREENGREAQYLNPLMLGVPAMGVRYLLEKLYANQGAEAPYVRISYAAGGGKLFSQGLIVLGVLLTCWGLSSYLQRRDKNALFVAIGGAVVLWIMLVYLALDYRIAVYSSLLFLVLLIGAVVRGRFIKPTSSEVVSEVY